MVGLGDTFFFAVKRSHLWVIVSTPVGPNGDFVMINMTSDHGVGEGVCILHPPDHPSFIVHPTEIRYKDARQWNITGFTTQHRVGKVVLDQPTSRTTLAKIQDGCFTAELFKFFPRVHACLVKPVVDPTTDVRVKARALMRLPYPPSN